MDEIKYLYSTQKAEMNVLNGVMVFYYLQKQTSSKSPRMIIPDYPSLDLYLQIPVKRTHLYMT